MYDNVAAWMIAGGLRAELRDQRATSHRVALRESRRAAKAERPGVIDRMRARFGIVNTSQTLDCCGA